MSPLWTLDIRTSALSGTTSTGFPESAMENSSRARNAVSPDTAGSLLFQPRQHPAVVIIDSQVKSENEALKAITPNLFGLASILSPPEDLFPAQDRAAILLTHPHS